VEDVGRWRLWVEDVGGGCCKDTNEPCGEVGGGWVWRMWRMLVEEDVEVEDVGDG